MPAKSSKAASVAIPISAQAASSIKRQNESLLQIVTEMSKNEEQRVLRISNARHAQEKKELERRFAGERKAEAARIVRLRDETKQMQSLAEKGHYNGTSRNRRTLSAKPVSDHEVTGLESRGGLTDSQYKVRLEFRFSCIYK